MNNLVEVNLDTLGVIADLLIASDEVTITHDWLVAPDKEVKKYEELWNDEFPIETIKDVVVFIKDDMLYIGDSNEVSYDVDEEDLVDLELAFPHAKVGDKVEFNDGEIIIVNYGYVYSEQLEINGEKVKEVVVWKIKY